MVDEVIQEQQPETLREALESAFKEAAEHQIDAPEEAPVEKPDVVEPEKATKSRGEDGKFKAAEQIDKEPKIVATSDLKAPTVTPTTDTPRSWQNEQRTKLLATATPELRAEIAKREQEFEKLATRQDDERNFGKQLKEVITPYMPIIQAEGGNPVAAVQNLLNTAYIMRTANPEQKTQLFMNLAKQYGVDLSQASQPSPYIDPQVETLQQRIQRLENERLQDTQRTQQQEQATLQRQIEAFATDPAHPHYETVKADMAALLAQGRAKDLDDAYEKACWVHPDIRSTLQQSQLQAAEEKRVADIKAKADQARRAGGSVNGGPGISVPNIGNPNRSLREELEANFRSHLN